MYNSFKIGDRVKVINNWGDAKHCQKGDTGTVEKINSPISGYQIVEVRIDRTGELARMFPERWELMPPSTKFKVGQLVICTDASNFGQSNYPPRKGEVREVAGVSGTGIFLELLGSRGVWSSKYFEPYDGLKVPTSNTFKPGDKVRHKHNTATLYTVTRFDGYNNRIEVRDYPGDYDAKYFVLVEPTIQVGDKGTIEVTVTGVHDKVIYATSGVNDKWALNKDQITITERAPPPPKPKRRRPNLGTVIKHNNRNWVVSHYLPGAGDNSWFVVREENTTQNYKLLHKNDPSWSN